jgi:regulator of cell morphogenesis and NO signaling
MVISKEKTIGELAAELPGAAHVFEKYGIDYCCGGKHALNTACRERGITHGTLLNELAETAAQREASADRDWNARPLRELIGYILACHHVYLRSELPRIAFLFAKMIGAHGDRQPVLFQDREILDVLHQELDNHMKKEELILFPMIETLEGRDGGTVPACFCSIEHPIARMEQGHEIAGRCLMQMRYLTLDYRLPDEACNTHRALFAALTELETDLHQHIHLENNVLFPRAVELEASAK